MEQNMKSAMTALAVMFCFLLTTGFSSKAEVAPVQNLASDVIVLETMESAQKVAETEKMRQEELAKIEEQKEIYRKDQELLAALIYCEAGNQPYDGQVAVGAVVLNRVKSAVYPDSISEVIYQSGQFGPAITGKLDRILASDGYTETAMQAAADAIAGMNPIGDCLHFGCGNYGIKIGDHYFH